MSTRMSGNDIKKALGSAIRQQRELCGLSQEALAFECGLHRTYIGSVERGERNIAILNIVAISEALNLTAARLLELSRL
jgi:transcriptional regulator with XRE-family HTH domain